MIKNNTCVSAHPLDATCCLTLSTQPSLSLSLSHTLTCRTLSTQPLVQALDAIISLVKTHSCQECGTR